MEKSNLFYLVKEQDDTIYIEKFIVEEFKALNDINFNQEYLCIIKSVFYTEYKTQFNNSYRCSKFTFIDKKGFDLSCFRFMDFEIQSIIVHTSHLYGVGYSINFDDLNNNKSYSINNNLGGCDKEIVEQSFIYLESLLKFKKFGMYDIYELVNANNGFEEQLNGADINNSALEEKVEKLENRLEQQNNDLKNEITEYKKTVRKLKEINKQEIKFRIELIETQREILELLRKA